MKPFLPYCRQHIDDADIAAVVDVLKGDWLTTGPEVGKFERALCERLAVPHAVACSSGTAALHLAALALELGPGDVVIVPAVTFLATANAARYAGADVVFADVDPDTGLMGPKELREALARAGRSVKAVFSVQLAGQMADATAIRQIARAAGAAVVEDACHAIGAAYPRDGGMVMLGGCADADMAVFSFHPAKTITMGEGGAVTTRDAALAARLIQLRSHGMTRDAAEFQDRAQGFDPAGSPNPWYYEQHTLGYNYRATDFQCALARSQLAKLDKFVSARQRLVEHYDRSLAGLAPTLVPLARTGFGRPAWHLYVALIDFARAGKTRGRVARELAALGIGTQVHYLPVPHQPYYRALYGRQSVPGADAYYARCLSLPLFPAMTGTDVDRVVEGLRSVLS